MARPLATERVMHRPTLAGASMLSNHLVVGLTEENDLLEPYIFKSNLSFDLVLEYYEEIRLMLKIVEDIDQKI